GVDIRLGRAASFYVESRFNLTVPDGAVDGSESGNRFDVTGQLLGLGLEVHFTRPTPPRIIRLNGPTTVRAGTSVTFAATVNEEAADRPLDYRWDFGDGGTATGRTATHTYDQSGRYVVSFSARNRAGEAEASTAVTAERPPEPPQIASVRAVPEPVAAGAAVQFSAAATGATPIAYEWRFGDGVTASEASPTHAYEAPGEYTARLQVSNQDGEDTRRVTVRVARPAGADTSGAGAAAPGPADSSETGPTTAPPADTSSQERWGIVVASMSEEAQAATVARRYREEFPGALRVAVRATERDEGARRHRVVIGPFEEAEAAQQILRERAEALPSGAWLLRLE
uniref:PKD domain-containing protein n=1 Tax=Salinibacter grassmerensis TaxID=3040353 RepID=UPI0021E84067